LFSRKIDWYLTIGVWLKGIPGLFVLLYLRWLFVAFIFLIQHQFGQQWVQLSIWSGSCAPVLVSLLNFSSRMCLLSSNLSTNVRLALQMSDWLLKCQIGSSVYCHDFFRKFFVFSQFVDSAPWYQVLRVELGSWVEFLFPRVVQASPPCGVTFVSPHVCRAWLMKIRGRVFLRFLKIDSE